MHILETFIFVYRIKSSEELELEELEKIPKFKARPLNKKVINCCSIYIHIYQWLFIECYLKKEIMQILESRGDVGLFPHAKHQITTPQEFHFATNDRFGPSATMAELFDKVDIIFS